MKICPGCGEYILFDDDKKVCPICGRTLVAWRNKEETSVSKVGVRPLTYDELSDEVKYTPFSREEFEVVNGRSYVLTGTVTEINSQTRVHNRFKKIVNSITRGEPYQFGHTSHETVIRVAENSNNGFPTHFRDVFFYGDVEGRFVIGDEIITTTQAIGDRLVVREMYNRTTDSAIRPTAQLSVATVGFLTLLMVLAIALFVWLIVSGRIISLMGAVIGGLLGLAISILTALAPILLIFLIFRYMLR